MNFSQIVLKNFLAVFIVIFGMATIAFIDLKDIVLGALIGFIGAVISYFFGSSTGSVAKDKIIKDLNDKQK